MANLLFLKHSISNLIKECTLYTKCITLILLIFYIISYVPLASKYLSVIPAYIIPPKFWIFSLLTFSFYECKIFFVIIDIILTFFIEKLLLPIFGWIELIKFCAFVNCLSTILTVFIYILFYAITYNEFYIFHVEIHGMAPLLAALTVSSRQLMGDNVLINLKIGKYRNKHISMTILMLFSVLFLLNIISLTIFIMYFNGLMISWIYLRFYQKHNNGIIGDLNEKFSFAGFFPYYMEGPVSVLTNSIFAGLIYLRICNKIDRRYDISSPTTISISISSGESSDSERRKQLALKALNDRLSRPEKQTVWPSLEEDKDTKMKSKDNSEPITKVFSDKYRPITPVTVVVDDFKTNVTKSIDQ